MLVVLCEPDFRRFSGTVDLPFFFLISSGAMEERTVHVSQLPPRLRPDTIRFNNGMEVLLWNGWHKVGFKEEDRHAHLQHGFHQNKNQT